MAGSVNGPNSSECTQGVTVEGAEPVVVPAHKPPRIMINVRDLRRSLGQQREEPIEVQLATQRVVGSWTDDHPVIGKVLIESIERGITMFGSVSFRWKGDCRRCLETTEGVEDIEIAEIFQVHSTEDSEINDFDGDQIDLVPVVCDAVTLSLPLAPLCRVDCQGSDPERYPAMTIKQSEEAKEAERAEQGPDPRWAALSDLDLSGSD